MEGIEHLENFHFCFGDVDGNDSPYDFEIYTKICMDGDVPQTDHPLPGNRRVIIPDIFRNIPCGFSDDLNISDHRIDGFLVSGKTMIIQTTDIFLDHVY
jgi:hypothetical protein